VMIAVRRAGNGFDMELTGMRPRDADAAAYARFVNYLFDSCFPKAELIQGSGGVLVGSGGGGASSSLDQIDMRRHFPVKGGQGGQGPVRVLWDVPTSVSEVTFSLAFDRVPTP